MRDLSKADQFLSYLVLFTAGVLIASFLPAAWLAGRVFLFSMFVAGLSGSISFWRKKAPRSAFLAVAIIFFALWRFSLTIPGNTPDMIRHYNGQHLTIVARVAAEPDVRDKNTRYALSAGKILWRRRETEVSGKILLTAGLYPRYSLGDELTIDCRLAAPAGFDGFAYDRYLARFGIYSVCDYPRIESAAHGAGGRTAALYVRNRLSGSKEVMRRLIASGLSEPEASLASGLVLGDQKGLPEDLKQAFAASGLSHIVAISGMNITFLALFVTNTLLFAGFWRAQTFYLTNLIIFGYILLIGLPPSALRAGLMCFLLLLAFRLGRLSKLTNSLVLAAALMVLVNPLILRDDLGFQLSFLALLGIIYFHPIISARFDRWSPLLSRLTPLRDVLSMTLAAQALTAPLLIYNFSRISSVAPLANLLALWCLPVLMILIFAALLLSLVLPFWSHLFFLPCYFMLKYLVLVACWCARLPGAALTGLYLPWAVWPAYYAFLFWVARRARIFQIRRM